jgi:acetolactate synthase-1/2/3 large subunit
MYTLQALWTMVRESLNVTTVVFANRDYAVLKREFCCLGVGSPGSRAFDMFEISRPDLDWVALAKGLGVPATRVTSLEAFGKALREGFGNEGRTLIEVPLQNSGAAGLAGLGELRHLGELALNHFSGRS